MDKASQALAEDACFGENTSFRARSRRSNVPRTTLQHRARGRRSLTEKAQSQQYLTPWEEKALVKFLVHQDALGRPVRIKYVSSIAFSLARRRTTSERPVKPPSKNWPRCFYRRHAELKASTAKALDWNRYDIREKVVHWFDIIGQVLQDPNVLQENVYNMDETGIMLSQLGSVKVLVSRDNERGCRGARIKRTTITAIECVSADGRYLYPMIIWPASTHRSNWSTWPTPGWHYGFSDSGFADSYLSLQWLKVVFDPQTKNRAGHKPRVLVCDGFGTHETLEVLEFCFENNIILCRLPSHTSHKLQPCDISVFGPLKAAYRDQVERLERGGVGTVGKEHFTYLYHPARERALTSRNIRSGWAKAGLFPFNPARVVKDLSEDPAELPVQTAAVVQSRSQHDVPPTPVTPISAEAVSALHDLIKKDAHSLDAASQQRLQRRLDKLTNATQLSFAERTLLQEQNRFLTTVNNEAKVRRSTKTSIIGKARVMSYEDLEKARTERSAKEAEKEARKAEKQAMKVKDSRVKSKTRAAETGLRKDVQCEHDVGAQDPEATSAQSRDGEMQECAIVPEPWRAPVAKMW